MDQVEFLKKTRLFETLELEEVTRLLPHLNFLAYEPDDLVFDQNDPGTSAFAVLEGQVEILVEISPTLNRTMLSCLDGDVFGEIALVDRRARSATARAVTRTAVVELPVEVYERIQEEEPAIALKLALFLTRLVAERLRVTTGLYAEAVKWGLEVSGAHSLGLHELAVKTPRLKIGMRSSEPITGWLLSVDTAGTPDPRLVVKTATGKVFVVPYHAIDYLHIEE